MSIQGNYKGVNRLCRGCSKRCKQFANVKVLKCDFKPLKSALAKHEITH